MILPFINIRKVPREMLKTSGFALGFQHLPWDLVNVNEWKIIFDPYIITTVGLHVYFSMSSHLPRDEALVKEDRIDEMKKNTHKKTHKKNNRQPVPHLLQTQQAPVLPYAKVVGRPGTGSYPAPSPDPTTHASRREGLVK